MARTIVPTVGRTTLRVNWSPRRDRVAAITTDGTKRFGTHGFFTSFGGGYGGQHYVELFSIPEMKPLHEAIRIPFTTADGIDPRCWSEDGEYLIIATSDQRRPCVIHTESEGD